MHQSHYPVPANARQTIKGPPLNIVLSDMRVSPRSMTWLELSCRQIGSETALHGQGSVSAATQGSVSAATRTRRPHRARVTAQHHVDLRRVAAAGPRRRGGERRQLRSTAAAGQLIHEPRRRRRLEHELVRRKAKLLERLQAQEGLQTHEHGARRVAGVHGRRFVEAGCVDARALVGDARVRGRQPRGPVVGATEPRVRRIVVWARLRKRLHALRPFRASPGCVRCVAWRRRLSRSARRSVWAAGEFQRKRSASLPRTRACRKVLRHKSHEAQPPRQKCMSQSFSLSMLQGCQEMCRQRHTNCRRSWGCMFRTRSKGWWATISHQHHSK